MKTGRNEPCPCGSGSKYKKCCGVSRDNNFSTTKASTPDFNIKNALQSALKYHRAGQIQEAEEIYRQILEADPNHPDALHLLGLTAHQNGDHCNAEKLIVRAIARDNRAPFFYLNLGNAVREQGKSDEAIESYKKALCLEPRFVEAHFNLANELLRQGKAGEAIVYYKKALNLNPNLAEAHYNLGRAFEEQGSRNEAEVSYRRTVQIKPDYAGAHYNLAIILEDQGRLDEAVERYQYLLKIEPDHAVAFNNLGNIFKEHEQLNEAEVNYRRAVQIKPDYADAHYNLAIILTDQGRLDEAIERYRHVFRIDPDHFKAYNNLAINFRYMGILDEAVESCRKAVAINPDCAEAHWNMSLALLEGGDFENGWEKYEWRFRKDDTPARPFPQLPWDGSSLKEKTLLVYAEQGVGDEIMFASCLPDVIDLANRCVVECDRRLVPLFARSFPLATVIPKIGADNPAQMQMPQIDTKIAIGSLPLFLRPDLAGFTKQKAYLIPDALQNEMWHNRFKGLGEGLKVGISWRGGQKGMARRTRSTLLEQWREIFSIPGLHFINLQYDTRKDELREAQEGLGVTIHDWEEVDPLMDLDGFAAQISALDLVISVDNSTVHMAGALGTPVWTLLPFACDWRWMRKFEDTPWYPSMRLFRQSSLWDWSGVFSRVSIAVKAAVEKGCAESGVPKSGWENWRETLPINQNELDIADNFIALSDSEIEIKERNKYMKAWNLDDRVYAGYSPGLEVSKLINFPEFFKAEGIKSILDAGIGSGKLCKKMLDMGFECYGVDIADNCLDEDLLHMKDKILTIGTLWDTTLFEEKRFDAIVCLDVMEHIPMNYIERVIDNYYRWTKKYLFLQIALFNDYFGSRVGEPLHLTVKPKPWWDEKLKEFRVIQDFILKNGNKQDTYIVYLLEKG